MIAMSADSGKTYQWIPTVYLLQGLPYALVTAVSPVLYKSMGMGSNSQIAFYTSLLTLPWIFKFFISPALEKVSTQKTWVVRTEFLMAALIFILGCSLFFTKRFEFSLILFFLIALVSSLHDINADGFYLSVLRDDEKARFIGIRTVFYQIGRLLCQGVLIMVVGFLVVKLGEERTWWSAFVFLSWMVALLAFYHH